MSSVVESVRYYFKTVDGYVKRVFQDDTGNTQVVVDSSITDDDLINGNNPRITYRGNTSNAAQLAKEIPFEVEIIALTEQTITERTITVTGGVK